MSGDDTFIYFDPRAGEWITPAALWAYVCDLCCLFFQEGVFCHVSEHGFSGLKGIFLGETGPELTPRLHPVYNQYGG